jgi:hypothetical protein
MFVLVYSFYCGNMFAAPLPSNGLMYSINHSLFFKPLFIYNLYIYIQQIGVRIECYGLGKGTQ